MALVNPALTYDDLAHLPDDGKRYELLEGELIVSPAPSPRHLRVVLKVARFLSLAEDAGWGQVYVAPLDVVFISRERLGIIGETNVRGAPDLVVEVISPSSRARDLRTKVQTYARFGVKYYWVSDPNARTVRVYVLTDEGYRAHPPLRAGQSLGCPLFPGITIDVGQLFE